ncbi:MAG: LuxR C-terminal-related transcriptional regulator [Lentibacter sp.]|uniref:helix-turn-helix transcriptional regulator n=1 Tax=Lentibacter sp. TaxID=2024994 RepID=UPI002615DFC1|nr:LuxR C-terminal-related transcriptional regulator [Lentibacter sp.]MDG1289101.1 LuxR C-terminal-related transcriptional regulator [Lentibacter sp.]
MRRVFIGDVVADYRAMGGFTGGVHFWFEMLAALSLVVTITFEAGLLMRMLRRAAHLQGRLAVTKLAVYDVIEAEFEAWKLSPAEADVASFLVKGFGIAEIATLRGSAEGTLKAHLNAIYRKSGAHSRGDVLSLLIDRLLDEQTN